MSDPVDDRPTGAMRTVMQKAASTMLKASSKATNAWVSRIRPEVDTSLFVEADTVTKLLDIPPARSGLDYATAFRVATHTPETFPRARRIYEAMRNPLAEQVQNLGAAMQRGETSAGDRLPQAQERLEEFDRPGTKPGCVFGERD